MDRIDLRVGYTSFAGQYENLMHATARLVIVVPATLATIFCPSWRPSA